MKAKKIICIAFVLISLASCDGSQQTTGVEKLPQEKSQDTVTASKNAEEERKEKMAGYRQQLLTVLEDTGNTQLKNLRLVNGEGGEALCGEFKITNSSGSHRKFTSFVVTEKPIENTSSKVIISASNEDSLLMMANQIRLKKAGC